ncbi:MAG: WecB/TagA/CpsF family glycosyltransferase [Chloroflexota bacterium]|nr:WecB/TagA/CpsF family glycosyltransferase [Chloroflexota bacterium]
MASERILLVQLADIGDLVLTTPAMAALREARPQAKIDLLASEQALPLVPGGLIDKRILFRRSGRSASREFMQPANLRALASLAASVYDTIVFFHHFTLRAGVFKFWLLAKASGARRIIGLKNHNVHFLTDSIDDKGFGALHQAQYWLNLVALLGADCGARPAQVRREPFPDSTLAASNKAKIVVHAGSGGYSRARRWPAESFAAVAQGLQAQYDARIVLVGSDADDGHRLEALMHEKPINLVGKTSLPQLADVIARAKLFIGADSGVMHIAAATGTPVVSIFGPSNPAAWRPWAIGSRATVLNSGVECSPCSYVGHGIGARDGCQARTCMKLVSPAQALEACARMLEPGRSPEPAAPSETSKLVMIGAESRLKILSVPVDAITYEGWMRQIGAWIAAGAGAQHVCTVNPEFIMIAQSDSIFFNILNRAVLCVPDGVGLLWASRYLGAPIPERVTGSDGVPLIAQFAAAAGWKIFFLGAAEGIAERAAKVLRQTHPGLIVAGAYGGSPAEDEEDKIVAKVNASGADILLVAYGAPKQEKWIARNLPRLEVAVAMGIGGSLDFIAGVVPRAPRWMRNRGLEWLYRLARQPWRFRRMLRLPRFVFAVWRHDKPNKQNAKQTV